MSEKRNSSVALDALIGDARHLPGTSAELRLSVMADLSSRISLCPDVICWSLGGPSIFWRTCQFTFKVRQSPLDILPQGQLLYLHCLVISFASYRFITARLLIWIPTSLSLNFYSAGHFNSQLLTPHTPTQAQICLTSTHGRMIQRRRRRIFRARHNR